jgi:Cu+-exporting ATPase
VDGHCRRWTGSRRCPGSARGRVHGREVLVGRADLLARHGTVTPPLDGAVQVAVDGAYRGAIVVADTVKPTSAEAVRRRLFRFGR